MSTKTQPLGYPIVKNSFKQAILVLFVSINKLTNKNNLVLLKRKRALSFLFCLVLKMGN